MPVLTLTTAGTSQAMATASAAKTPTSQFISRMTIDNLGPGILYFGFQKPLGVSSVVSSTVFDKSIQPGDSYTHPPSSADKDNNVDLAATWFDASADATKFSYAPETT